MKNLMLKFDLLGFDLDELENLIYFSAGPIPPPPPSCGGGSCDGGCSGGCTSCKPDCNAGGK